MEGTNTFSTLGLDPFMNAKDSLVNSPNRLTPWQADSKIGVNPGALNYYQTGKGRSYQAVVGMAPAQGVFVDIQAAINFVNSKGGGDVFITTGTYTPQGTFGSPSRLMQLYNNVNLIGQDANNTVIDFSFGTSSSGTIAMLRTDGTVGNIKIDNLSFINGVGTAVVIRFQNVSDLWMTRCMFSNPNALGDINLVSGSRCTIDQCSSGTSAVFFNSSVVSTHVVNNEILGGKGAVFVLNSQAGSARVWGNSISTTGNQGVYVNSQNDILISGNYVSLKGTGGTAIFVDGNRTIISGNNISIPGSNIVGIGLTTNGTTDQIVSENIIGGAGSIGIQSVNSKRLTILGNRVVGCTTGISLGTAVDRAVVVANNLAGCTTGISDNSTNGTSVGNITV